MSKAFILPAAVTAILGLSGTALVLYAWQLPPFSGGAVSTENAYVRGQVTTLSPQISGYVAEVLVSDFADVTAGQPLVRLDDASALEKVAQAEAALAIARSNLDVALLSINQTQTSTRGDEARLTTAKLALSNAETESARIAALRTKGVISDSAQDQSELALRKAQSALTEAEVAATLTQEKLATLQAQEQIARSQILQAEATLKIAKLDLEHTVITAPSDGRLGQVSARVGQFVSAGTALASHVGKDHWVIANFTENAYDKLTLGQEVRFTVDAMGSRALTGHIASFSPATASEFSLMSGTNATGNFTKVVQRLPVRIEIDADQPLAEQLTPGMSVVVSATPL